MKGLESDMLKTLGKKIQRIEPTALDTDIPM